MRPSQNEMFSYHTVVFKFFVVVWSHESDFCAELECASKALRGASCFSSLRACEDGCTLPADSVSCCFCYLYYESGIPGFTR